MNTPERYDAINRSACHLGIDRLSETCTAQLMVLLGLLESLHEEDRVDILVWANQRALDSAS